MSAGPGRRRGRPPSGAREAILRAAFDLLRDEGLTQATTKQIARRAGVSEASIHYHFGGKAGLLEAALVAGLEPLWEFDRALRNAGMPDRPTADVLLEMGAELERFFDTIIPIIGATQSDAGLRASFNELLAAGDHGPHRGVALVTRYLEAAQRRGELRPRADLTGAALLFVGACLFRAWERHLRPPGRQQQLLPDLEGAVATLLDGLQRLA